MYRLRLKEIRKAAGFKTQKDMADYLGMKERKYTTWERGEVALSLEDAYMLSVVLGCTPNDLCGWYDDHPQQQGGELRPEEKEIINRYRACTPTRQGEILNHARDAAVASKEATERDLSNKAPLHKAV